MQNHRGGDNGPGKRTATGLINAGDLPPELEKLYLLHGFAVLAILRAQ
jgi:hypothetical protein